MKMPLKFIIILSYCILTTSCATLLSHRKQSLKIDTSPQGANVYIGQEYIGQSPCYLISKRVKSNVLTLEKSGYAPAQYELSIKLKPAIWWNWLVLGPVGMLFDIGTGSGLKYAKEGYSFTLEKLPEPIILSTQQDSTYQEYFKKALTNIQQGNYTAAVVALNKSFMQGFPMQDALDLYGDAFEAAISDTTIIRLYSYQLVNIMSVNLISRTKDVDIINRIYASRGICKIYNNDYSGGIADLNKAGKIGKDVFKILNTVNNNQVNSQQNNKQQPSQSAYRKLKKIPIFDIDKIEQTSNKNVSGRTLEKKNFKIE